MKVLKLQDMEFGLDDIVAEVNINKKHININEDGIDMVIIPFQDYEVLKGIYKEWLKEPTNKTE
tara:strand:+ start:318 stop:509 length:192 start_codon:yes stop_codon:yes gene_type:complete